MKKLVITLFSLFLSINFIAQKICYPNLDVRLLKISEAAAQKDFKSCSILLSDVLSDWDAISSELGLLKSPQYDIDFFVKNTDRLLTFIKLSIEEKDQETTTSSADQVIYNFMELRDCITVSEYPLDPLLTMKLIHDELHYTVHDPMFGLLYWFEFQDLVDDITDYYDEYNVYDGKHIQSYFPDLDIAQHDYLKGSLDNCIQNFIDSLDTAYQDDFEIPCDAMGQAIDDLIQFYSNSKVKSAESI